MLFIMTPRERRERRESLPEWLRKHEKIKFKTTLEVARFVFDVCGISEYVPDDIDNFPGAPDIIYLLQTRIFIRFPLKRLE